MPAPDLSAPTITIGSWHDPVVDALGYPPRSTYVERFWLSILGPSSTWLLRHIDSRLEASPDGITLDLEATAGALGLGTGRGRHSPLVRSLHRCCQFGLARAGIDTHLVARRAVPPLTRHQVQRLPDAVRRAHDDWRDVERDAGTIDVQQRRARRIALALADLGEDVPTTEQRLHRYRIHPVVAREAAVWAHRIRIGPRVPDASAAEAAPPAAPAPLVRPDRPRAASSDDRPDDLTPADLGGDAA